MGVAAKFSKGKAREERMRERGRARASNACLFSIKEGRGPAVKRLHRRWCPLLAWSQALFWEVLIKNTKKLSFFNWQIIKHKSPILGDDQVI